MNVYTHKPIPAFILQHPRFSLADRVLFAYMMYANEEGECFVSSANIAILVGEVGPDGEPTEQNLVNIRKARHSLMAAKTYKDGSTSTPSLVHVKKPTKRGRHQDVYVVTPVTLSGKAIDLMSMWGGKKKESAHAYANVQWRAPVTEGKVGEEIDLTGQEFSLDDLLGETSAPLEDGFDLDTLLDESPGA